MFDSIYVELTSVCNMSCDFCVSRFMKRPKAHMNFDFFRNVIDQISANNLTKRINLAAIGESLLYPKLLDAIRYCRERKLETSIITNGLILTNDLYQSMLDAGLNEINISLHDLTPESFIYRHANTGIDYYSFFSNLIRLIDYHVSRSIPNRLIVNLLFCKEKWISGKLWDLPEIKNNTKNAAFLLQPFIDAMNKIAGENNIKCHLNRRKVNSSLQALDVFKSRSLKIMDNIYLNLTSLNSQKFNTRIKLNSPFSEKIKLIKKTRGFCRFLGAPMILANGSFIPCCIDGLEELVIGRVDLTPLTSLISSEQYQNLIKGFKNNIVINSACQECMGKLVYKNRFLRIWHLVSTFNLDSIIYSGRQFLLETARNKLSKRNKERIKSIRKKINVFFRNKAE